MFHQRLIDLAWLAPLGLLDPLEELLLAAHLVRGCERCSRALHEATETLSPIQPSPELRKRVLRSVKQGRQ